MLFQQRVEVISVVGVELRHPRVEHAGRKPREPPERGVSDECVQLGSIFFLVVQVARLLDGGDSE